MSHRANSIKRPVGMDPWQVSGWGRELRKSAVIALVLILLIVAGIAATLIFVTSVRVYAGEALNGLVMPWRRPYWDLLDESDKAQAEGQIRLAVVQAVVALGALCALIYTARTFRLARRGHVTDRLNTALERLDSEEMYVRIGGILALREVMEDYPDRSMHAIEVLSAFLRQRTSTLQAGAAAGLPETPDDDTRLALKTLGMQVNGRERSRSVNLKDLYLVGADLRGADLRCARLHDSNLQGADLNRSNLSEATLHKTDFRRAEMVRANLKNADLFEADFRDSTLTSADFRGASLVGAKFGGAVLDCADFRGAQSLSTGQLKDAKSCHGVKLDKELRKAMENLS